MYIHSTKTQHSTYNMNGYKLHSTQLKVVHEDKVSKICQFGTLTCSPVSPDSGTTMLKIKELHTFLVEVNFYPKSPPRCGIFEIRGEKFNRLSFVSNRLEKT